MVGGGIAGVTCAKVLALDCLNDSSLSVLLISASPIVKMVSNLRTLGRSMDLFDVVEQNSSAMQTNNLKVIVSKVIDLNFQKHELTLSDQSKMKYSKLCICTGGRPKMIKVDNLSASKYIKCLRDTQTVKDFVAVLKNAKRIMIVGNGGIACELVHEVEHCQIVWAIKDKSFGATFYDAAASKFFEDSFDSSKNECRHEQIKKQHQYAVDPNIEANHHEFGVALGPNWHSQIKLSGQAEKKLTIENSCEVRKVYHDLSSIPKEQQEKHDLSNEWNIYVELTNGSVYGCDMLISAIGVEPNCDVFKTNNPFKLAKDGGLLVSTFQEIY